MSTDRDAGAPLLVNEGTNKLHRALTPTRARCGAGVADPTVAPDPATIAGAERCATCFEAERAGPEYCPVAEDSKAWAGSREVKHPPVDRRHLPLRGEPCPTCYPEVDSVDALLDSDPDAIVFLRSGANASAMLHRDRTGGGE